MRFLFEEQNVGDIPYTRETRVRNVKHCNFIARERLPGKTLVRRIFLVRNYRRILYFVIYPLGFTTFQSIETRVSFLYSVQLYSKIN